ncbi:hypothetical protein Tco_1176989 [Tanacetum coccineum]
MQCTTMELFTPPPDEVLSTHEPPNMSAQYVGFTRNVRRRLTTSQNVSPKNDARLIRTSEENFRSIDILGSHDTFDSTTVPIHRIFDRFRNMPTDNVVTCYRVIDTPYSIDLNMPYGSSEEINKLYLGRKFDMSYSTGGYAVSGGLPEQSRYAILSELDTAYVDSRIRRIAVSVLGKRPLSTTSFSHDYAAGGVLPAPSELHVDTTSRIFDCFRNVDVNNFLANIVVHTDMTQDAVTQELFSWRPGL